LVTDFHASRAAVSFAFSLFNTIGALLIPCTGMIIDRFGARRVILVFTVLYGLALCSVLWPARSLWQLSPPFTILVFAMASCLQPDGDEADEKDLLSLLPPPDKQGMTWHEIWHSPTFWILISIFSLAGACVHGAVLHISAIFTDRGVTPERAAIATSLVGIAVMLGRLASGYLLDRLFAPRVAILFYSATALGMAILCAGISGPFALLASFLVG